MAISDFRFWLSVIFFISRKKSTFAPRGLSISKASYNENYNFELALYICFGFELELRIKNKSFNLLSGLAWIFLCRWGPFGFVGRSAGGGPSASWEISAVGDASAFDESAG